MRMTSTQKRVPRVTSSAKFWISLTAHHLRGSLSLDPVLVYTWYPTLTWHHSTDMVQRSRVGRAHGTFATSTPPTARCCVSWASACRVLHIPGFTLGHSLPRSAGTSRITSCTVSITCTQAHLKPGGSSPQFSSSYKPTRRVKYVDSF